MIAAAAPRIYLPGDARDTKYVEQLWIIANAIERSTTMFLTATHYAAVIAELRAQHGAPGLSTPPHLEFGKRPKLTVINSGTDDEVTVNAKNRETPGAIDFQAKIERLRVA